MNSGSVIAVLFQDPAEGYSICRVGFMGDGFNPEILKNSHFGMSVSEFFKVLKISPRKARRLFPSFAWRVKIFSIKDWGKRDPLFLTLELEAQEFQKMANIVGFPILRYQYNSGDPDVEFLGRTNPPD